MVIYATKVNMSEPIVYDAILLKGLNIKCVFIYLITKCPVSKKVSAVLELLQLFLAKNKH